MQQREKRRVRLDAGSEKAQSWFGRRVLRWNRLRAVPGRGSWTSLDQLECDRVSCIVQVLCTYTQKTSVNLVTRKLVDINTAPPPDAHISELKTV